MIDRTTKERIKEAADIADVVKEFVQLRRAGRNLKGLCPFHNEKTPSFIVFPATQNFHCFGCGKGGDVINFVMEAEQLSYVEALQWLGRRYGIEVKDKELSDDERKAYSHRESLFILNEWAADYFENILHSDADGTAVGMAYLRQRGLRDDIIRRFRLGFALDRPSALADAATQKGFDPEFLVETGLCFKTDDGRLRDKYRGRVIYPIHTVSGKVVGFGGRILTNDKKLAKYINSPQSDIYDKSSELYGLYLGKKAIARQDLCYMVEGYMDVIAMHQNGVENVVASSGTSLTLPQIRLLHRFTNNVVLLYDGDAAGIHAATRGVDLLLAEGINIKVLLLPDGHDPDSFARQCGSPEEFQDYLKQHATDFIRFKARLLLSQAADDPRSRAGATESIVESISFIPDGITRQAYAHDAASMLATDERLLLYRISQLRKQRREAARAADSSDAPAAETAAPPAPQSEAVSTVNYQLPTDELPYERELIREVVLFGERRLFDREAADAADPAACPPVAVYVRDDLRADGLELQVPLYRRMLEEAANEAQKPDFVALDYFQTHPNPDISRCATTFAVDSQLLSTEQQRQYGSELDRLDQTIPRLLNDYKYGIVARRRKEVEKQINAAAAAGDMDKCRELMGELKTLNTLFAALAKAVGGKVVSSL